MGRRYLFVSPDMRGASGGVAVLRDAARALIASGREAAMLFPSPSATYGELGEVPALHAPEMRRRALRAPTPRKAAHWARKALAEGRGPRLWKAWTRRPGDVLVVPEFMLDEVGAALPGLPRVPFVQAGTAWVEARARQRRAGQDPDAGVVHTLAASEACDRAVRALAVGPTSYVPAAPDLSLYPYRADKRRRIAYMPRRRRGEARTVVETLRARGRLGDFELVEVDGRTQAEVARIVGESLIFVSLMKGEALGFPAMEAMAAGCVVVGYDGTGGAEYFDATTGIPVTEDQTAELIAAVEAVVARADADPASLDALRRRASEAVRARYTRAAFEAALLAAWARIEADLDSA